ncbi:hypothetical protein Sdagh_38240 [Streptomyces daghestanicus]|uniref:Uncharacterized protein n=1 Tax=Streptomyces daghestanicus TaxID=66885 RepID=A0ABQ3Q4B2_9ACTN|nr:hypothetical protein GCM10010240_13030 [Streptomyces griseoviridis]GHI32094.1 hypothetical protein Sdagh_38240 [Streptomyces daghestanicus]
MVAPVSWGAQVMTVTVSSAVPPATPGTTPQPTASDAPAATVARVEEIFLIRRLPVMKPHDSPTGLTWGRPPFNAR